MEAITIERAKQLLGNKTHSLSDAEIQAKIDIMMILANRCYDIIESKNINEANKESTTSGT